MALFFSESGGDKSGLPLVLLHGFCESHEVWKRLEGELSEKYHVLSPDLPGFGKSPLMAGDRSISAAASELHSWLRELNIKKCILIGHSLGGYVALAFLEKYPQWVEGLCLFHSTAFADTDEKKRTRDNVIDFVEKNGVEKFITSFVPPLFFHKNRAGLQREINELITIGSATPKETVITYTRAMQQRPDRLEALKDLAKPILFIAGDEDSSVPLEDSKKQVEVLPGCKLVILKQTGHMGMYEQPDESIEVLRDFISGLI